MALDASTDVSGTPLQATRATTRDETDVECGLDKSSVRAGSRHSEPVSDKLSSGRPKSVADPSKGPVETRNTAQDPPSLSRVVPKESTAVELAPKANSKSNRAVSKLRSSASSKADAYIDNKANIKPQASPR